VHVDFRELAETSSAIDKSYELTVLEAPIWEEQAKGPLPARVHGGGITI